ncbi:hypothetical protein PV768_13850 [Pseudarthrobacter sp. CC4]|uniref:hypothetical protein n=1 Tax=unclassified Pseudarthrobacter TaxID=2647000 RepID=UPI0012FC367B|nr:hypothetical protein [Pseudarthrobacter sp. GA104]MUU69667.1 hypothetical protein [Pseudarthrobacter sp. GA104]
MRFAEMGTSHTALQMKRRVRTVTQNCAGWINKGTFRLSETPKSKLAVINQSGDTSTPGEAAALLAALIRIALINGEITEADERRLAFHCHKELLNVQGTTDLITRQAIVSKLSELILQLTIRTEDTVFQTLSPRRLAALRAVFVSEV